MEIDLVRLERQKECVADVKRDLMKCHKSLIYCAAGFGKTYMATDLMFKPALKKNPNIKIVVLVGSDFLRDQWDKRTQDIDCKIYTWQGIFNKKPKSIQCDLLIIDEFHKVALTKEYSRSFTKTIAWKDLVCLTGTLNKKHMHMLDVYEIPISHTVTREEAIEKGWLNKRVEYNLRVELDYGESMKYVKYDEMYTEAGLFIDPDIADPENTTAWVKYGNIGAIQKRCFIIGYKLKDGKEIKVKNLANREKELSKIYIDNKDKIKYYKTGKRQGEPYTIKHYPIAKQVADMRGVDVGVVVAKASDAARAYNLRKKVVYNTLRKVEIVKKFIDMYPDRKIITFSLETKFTDLLAKHCGGNPYHGKQRVTVQRKIIKDFIDAESGSLHTVGKIAEGADVPGVDTAINCSYHSEWTTKEQKDARAGRIEEGKGDTIILNLYCVLNRGFGYRPTFERFFLMKAQKDKEVTAINIEGIDEIDI